MILTCLQERRDKLSQQLEIKQAAIFFAAKKSHAPHFFLQDKNFFYFTGLETPSAIYMVRKTDSGYSDVLFIERPIPENEVWEGAKMTKEEACIQSGIKHVLYIDEYPSVIFEALRDYEVLLLQMEQEELMSPPSLPLFRGKQIQERLPQLQLKSNLSIMTVLRSTKDEWELQQIQRAIDITGKGIVDIMEQAKAGMVEYELESVLHHRMNANGYRHWGFLPIVASGMNATTLHYGDNNCIIEENQLVLLDVGADSSNYSADITRTFPIAAAFSPRQKAVYEEVLQVEKAIIEMVKPGILLRDLNEQANELIAEACVRLGLIDDKADYRRYYMHGIGHPLGLDTHDLFDRNTPLAPGQVITVEPGIYIQEEQLGVRIEDDVLVTDEGYCVLSQHIPKEVSELEEIRAAALSKQ